MQGYLRQHASTLNLVRKLVDLMLVFFAGLISYYFSPAYETFSAAGEGELPGRYLIVLSMVVGITALVFPLSRVYRVWRGSSTLSEIRCLTLAWLVVAMLMMTLAFVTKSGADYSRSWIGLWFISAWVALVLSRVVLRMVLKWLRSNGYNHRHIVIVGTGEQAAVVSDRLMKSAWFGLEISAWFDAKHDAVTHKIKDKTVISDYSELLYYVSSRSVDQVWIALPHSEEETIRRVIETLDGVPVEIRYVPDVFEYQLMHHSLTEMAGIPVVNISYSAIDGANRVVKAMEDYVLASLLLVLASPAMLLIAIGVKLSSPGPILYRQTRVGWNGKEFTMLKFRTMPVDVEKETGPVWAKAGERRATPFGQFLRKTSLDELPQLFNVLMGEMSLIGPRPERPVFVEKYKDEIPHYNKKHLVKAGLTGWAQVHGWRGNTCLHTRIEHDLYYIENWSLWLDIKIIIMTIFRGLIHKNAY